jgi:TPP-dependent pyruvate/acetoin dehydrogenase alpha subunit
VAEAVERAVASARAGEGPALIEAVTYRFGGHYVGDPERYRPADEVREWMELRDPLARARGTLDVVRAAEIEAAADRHIDNALAFALASPPTGTDDLVLDHYGPP